MRKVDALVDSRDEALERANEWACLALDEDDAQRRAVFDEIAYLHSQHADLVETLMKERAARTKARRECQQGWLTLAGICLGVYAGVGVYLAPIDSPSWQLLPRDFVMFLYAFVTAIAPGWTFISANNPERPLPFEGLLSVLLFVIYVGGLYTAAGTFGIGAWWLVLLLITVVYWWLPHFWFWKNAGEHMQYRIIREPTVTT